MATREISVQRFSLTSSRLYGLRRNQSFNFQLATIRELMAISAFFRTYPSFLRMTHVG